MPSKAHMKFRKMKFSEKVPNDSFLPHEQKKLLKYGSWLQALDNGTIQPESEAQKRFVQVCRLGQKPGTSFERLWIRYKNNQEQVQLDTRANIIEEIAKRTPKKINRPDLPPVSYKDVQIKRTSPQPIKNPVKRSTIIQKSRSPSQNSDSFKDQISELNASLSKEKLTPESAITCIDCGCFIGNDRLDAFPEAKRCISCQQKIEELSIEVSRVQKIKSQRTRKKFH